MFNSDKILRAATAAVGALILTTVSVGAAVGPARTAETTPVYALALSTAQSAVQANG
jgi:hypothetical protein